MKILYTPAVTAYAVILFLQACNGHKSHPPQPVSAGEWEPVSYRVLPPEKGVILNSGVFKTMFENNTGYLLHSFTTDQMLRPFRLRAGIKDPPAAPFGKGVWTSLPGSNAGRFLMGQEIPCAGPVTTVCGA